MRYRAVIFDLDGVICRTDRYHYEAWKRLADRLGICFDEEINLKLRGVSRMESLEILLGAGKDLYSAAEKADLAEEKNRNYRALLERMSPDDLPKGVRATLKTLRQMGLKLAVASSSKNTQLILGKLGLQFFFDAVTDGTQISRSKPDPEVFRLAAEKIGVRPEECLVVEDAPAGVQAAVAGNFDAAFLGVDKGCQGALYRIADITELVGIVSGAPKKLEDHEWLRM